MRIRFLVGATSLAALVTLAGIGCSSNPDTGTGDEDSGAHDGAVARDGAVKDASPAPQADGGVDAEAVHDGSVGPVVDASDAGPSKEGPDSSVTDASVVDANVDAGHDAATTDAATTDAATTDAAATDAATTDAATSHDAAVGPDATVPPPDGGDPDAALVCAPSDESGFVPVWHPPTAHSSSCTQAQMDAYHTCLIDSQTQASPASCNPFSGTSVTPANKVCLQCILTQDTAAVYGPIVIHKGTIEMNVAGCLSLATQDLQGTGCGAKYQAASECKNASCSATCPVTDEASFTLEQQCETAAAAGTCKPLEDAAGCADGLVEAGGAPAACLSGQSFDDLYTAIVPIFCGG